MNTNELSHIGVLGMRWGRRKGPQQTSSGGRHFTPKSLTKNMDGRKTNKLFGKRNRKAMGKKIVDTLMTPQYSKTKFTDMTPAKKRLAISLTAAAIAAVGGLMYADIKSMG